MTQLQKKMPSLFLIILLVGFPQISETIYTPSLPDIAKSLLTSDEKVQLTLSIYFLGFALGVSIWGIIADFYGRWMALFGGIIIYTITSILLFISPSIDMILFLRFFQALGASTGSVIGMTMIRDIYTGVERAKVFSTIGAALAISPALGPIIGGVLDHHFGWRANFLALTLMGFILALIMWMRPFETRPDSIKRISRSEFTKLVITLFLDKKVIICALIIGACNGIIFSYYAEAPFIFIDILKLTPSQYGLLGIGISVATLLSSFLSRKLNSKFNSETLIQLGSFIILTGSILLFFISFSFSVLLIILSIMIIFIGIGLVIPNTINLSLSQYQNFIGTASSIFGLFYYLLISLFTAIMSNLHDDTIFSMPKYFIVLAIILFFSSMFLKLAKGKYFPQQKNQV